MSKEVSKTPPLSIIIRPEDISAKTERIDRVLATLNELPSRSQIKSWFEEGRIRRADEILTASSKVSVGDKILIDIPPPREMSLEAREMKFEIYFEDDSLIVFYKPRGISMHPGAGKKDETTIVHGLLHHVKNNSGARELSSGSATNRPGLVHRLDKDTEGLVVVAKNNEVHEALAQQFSDRSIDRRYWALVWGKTPPLLKIDLPIGRHPIQRKKFAVNSRGKEARTQIKTIKHFAEYSWVECKLETGRTHQIRVHLSHKAHPVLNDPLYSRPRKMKDLELQKVLETLKGQALMAFELGFNHPVTKERMHFEAPMPDWLKKLT